MSIANCLAKLVAAGRVSQKAADDALAIHEGVQGRLYPEMGPATADAGAALEAARIMAQAAKERKLEAAQQAIRQAEALNRMELHPQGKTTGLMSMLVRDNWEAGAAVGNALNIDSHAEAVTKRMLGIMNGALEPYKSRIAGLRQDTETIWNVADELFGKDTGDEAAKAAAKAFTDTTQYGLDRVKRAGKRVASLEDWRLPQFWDASRAKMVTEREFTDDLMNEINAGTMHVMDKGGFGEAPRAAIPGIIQNAYKDITLGRGTGAAGPSGFSNQLRVFRFDHPDAYKRLMKKYGVGDGGLYNTLMGHIGGMGKEIAFVEVLGPQYEANFKKLLDVATKDDAERAGSIGEKIKRSITMNSPGAVQRTFDSLSGKLGMPQSELIAGIGGGLRNLQTASRLGSATVSAVPGDSMTMFLAARHSGIPAAAVLGRFVRDLANDHEAEALARQLNITASSIMDAGLGTKRFADEVVGQGLSGRVAETFMRVSGLNAWTEGLKRAFSMEFMGLIARQSEQPFEKLDPTFRGFLDRYGFNAADWDGLRSASHIEADGAKFFDVNSVEDQRLADRMMSAIIDERHMAVLEPDARIRGAVAGGTQRGTIVGEAVRSATQFKSFPLTYMMTHMMRAAAQDGGMTNKAIYLAKLIPMMTIAGAATVQAQALISGRDPSDMGSPQFWLESFVRGGGAGMMGDLVNSSTTRGGDGLKEFLMGPAPNTISTATGDLIKTLASPDYWNGDKQVSGKTFAQHIKAWVPGSSLWYTKLATDRLIFDNIQAMVDPDYRTSFSRYEKRMKKDFGQTFWWGPGKSAPTRAPELPPFGSR
nr:MAG TPA: structural protein [Caudoviricetes sp.]